MFVHYDDDYKTLSKGLTVGYDIIQGQQGLQADFVRVVKDDSSAS